MQQRTDQPTSGDTPTLAQRVSTALGFTVGPEADLGETATHRTVWDVACLNDIYRRTGGVGTVTARAAGGIYLITLTLDVDGTEVTVESEWDPHSIVDLAFMGLPVMRALAGRAPAQAAAGSEVAR